MQLRPTAERSSPIVPPTTMPVVEGRLDDNQMDHGEILTYKAAVHSPMATGASTRRRRFRALEAHKATRAP